MVKTDYKSGMLLRVCLTCKGFRYSQDPWVTTNWTCTEVIEIPAGDLALLYEPPVVWMANTGRQRKSFPLIHPNFGKLALNFANFDSPDTFLEIVVASGENDE